MAVGHTLTRSSHVVFAELDWVPANISQAEDRTHRIGQKENVLIQHLVFDGSLDARMADILVKKQEVIDRALDKVTEPEAQLSLMPEPAKEKPATTDTKREKIDKIAAEITEEKAALILVGLKALAGMCDGAREVDGAGFNKMDTALGKSLATNAVLSSRQAALGYVLCNKYRRQLGGLMEEINITKM